MVSGAEEVSERPCLCWVPSIWVIQEDDKEISLGQTGGPLKQRTPTVKYCLVFSVVIWIYAFHCRFDSVSCLVDVPVIMHGMTGWMKDKTYTLALLLSEVTPGDGGAFGADGGAFGAGESVTVCIDRRMQHLRPVCSLEKNQG